MALLNYTTTISAAKSIGEIQEMLVKAGARSILLNYDGGAPSAIKFLVPTGFGELGYALPANTDAVWQTLRVQGNRRDGNGRRLVPERLITKEQAQRVAWRIVKDWLEAQLAIIETGMVRIEQVMLPYQVVEDERTVYDVLAEGNLQLPPGLKLKALPPAHG